MGNFDENFTKIGLKSTDPMSAWPWRKFFGYQIRCPAQNSPGWMGYDRLKPLWVSGMTLEIEIIAQEIIKMQLAKFPILIKFHSKNRYWMSQGDYFSTVELRAVSLWILILFGDIYFVCFWSCISISGTICVSHLISPWKASPSDSASYHKNV